MRRMACGLLFARARAPRACVCVWVRCVIFAAGTQQQKSKKHPPQVVATERGVGLLGVGDGVDCAVSVPVS